MNLVALSTPESARWATGRFVVRAPPLLLLGLAGFALGNVGRIPLLEVGSRQAPVLLNDLSVAAVVLAGALAMGNARSLKLNDVSLAALVFASIGALSVVASVAKYGLTAFEVVASLAYLARWGLYFGLYLTIVNCLRMPDVERTWTAMERVFLLMAAFGIVQAVLLPNFAFMVYPQAGVREWDVQGNRLVSTVLDPNIMAGLIDVMLLVMLGRMAFGVRVALWKPLLLVAALLMTLSRGGLLSLFAGGLVIVAVRGVSRRIAKLVAVGGVILLLALPSLVELGNRYTRFSISDASALARLYKWAQALDVLRENPWFGIGFNAYGFVQQHRGFEPLSAQSYSAEGGLLFIAVMTGLVGLSVYVFMLWRVLRRCRWGWSHHGANIEHRGLFLGTAAGTVAVLVNTLFVNTLLVPLMMELLWILWGLTFVTAAWLRDREELQVQ